MTSREADASALRAGDMRITLLAALAWRAMTEIVRRRHRDYRFELLQVHPSISMAGLISNMGYGGGLFLMGWTGGYVLLAMLPDTGELYLSTVLFEGVNEGSDDEWLASLG